MVLVSVIANFGHDDLELQRLVLPRENVADHLGKGISQTTTANIFAAVGIALGIREPDADLSKLIELAEFANACEG